MQTSCVFSLFLLLFFFCTLESISALALVGILSFLLSRAENKGNSQRTGCFDETVPSGCVFSSNMSVSGSALRLAKR